MRRAGRSSRGLGRRGAALLALALAALIAFVAWARRDDPSAPAPALAEASAIPPGAILIVEIDLAALRRHPLGAELLGQGREIAGLGEVAALCRVDPLQQIDRLALAVPELEGVGFGLFARGRFDAETILACAAEVVRRRGGRPAETPAASFRVMRDASLDGAELAVRDGALVLAEPPYLAQALGAEAHDDGHGALRALVPPGLVVATAVLSEAQRRTLVDELRAQGEPDSPLAKLRDAALSLRLGVELEADAVLRCSDPDACRQVAAQLAARRDDLARLPALRVLGASDLVQRVAIHAEGERVRLRATATPDELTAVLDRLRLLEQLMTSPEEPAAPAPSAAVPDDAGERVDPRETE